MTRGDGERIADMVEACVEIAELVARGRAAFESDRAIQLALERLLEIIGECASALAPETRSRFNSVDWRGLSGLRIVLAHHYHRVDRELVWTMATDEVPVLKGQLDPLGS